MPPITTVDELDEALSRPMAGVLETLTEVAGDIAVLGAGGKMGPTLAWMIRRAFEQLGQTHRRVIAVSRFSSGSTAEWLRQRGVDVVPCDLLDCAAMAALPDVPNVIYMAGQKFGTLVAERYPQARMVALSTGCVYPLKPWQGPGSHEDDPLGPPGDYANSCVGRERVLSYFAHRYGSPLCLVRLCYAIDLRYGVLLDLARKVCNNEPIDLSMGATHVIWQGDANARIIQCLSHTTNPPCAVNLTGRERLLTRDLAVRFGELLQRELHFAGNEAPTAWVWNADKSYEWFGPPSVTLDEMLVATANWVRNGGSTLNKPTHFEVRDGQF
jgi:nucleoside-diphosphate-sugar epimerase